MPARRPTLEMEDMEDDSDSNRGDSAQPEDGVKSSSVRKAQNRIAQREFRLRKQQYVRDLEARVEVMSADKEERVELMTLLIRNLLQENKDLRNMVKTMASFVGEGLGSCLPRLGLSAPQLDAILNRADTDTAYEAFINLKASREMEAANPGLPLGEVRRRASVKRKRSSVDGGPPTADRQDGGASSNTPDVNPAQLPNTSTSTNTDTGGESSKRPRSQQPTPPNPEPLDSYAYLFPDLDAFATDSGSANPNLPNPQGSWANMYGGDIFQQSPGPTLTYPYAAQFSQVNSGFGLTVPPSEQRPSMFPVPMSEKYPQTEFPLTDAPAPGTTDPVELERQRQLRAAVANLTSGEGQGSRPGSMTDKEMEERRGMQDDLRNTLGSGTDRDRRTEALQLITYHLNNFRVNHSYSLPTSLRPTKVQRTIPHEHAIDGIIFPSIRDRMILLRGRYDLVDAFQGMLNEFTIHGQDVLDHHSWECSEKWLRDFKILADEEVYDITNKWRMQRGEAPLVRPAGSGVVPPQQLGVGN